MARQPVALGVPALIESLQTLSDTDGRAFMVRPGAVRLEPGSIWSGDAMVISATPGSVRFACGDALYGRRLWSSCRKPYTPASRPVWMPILFSAQRGFALKWRRHCRSGGVPEVRCAPGSTPTGCFTVVIEPSLNLRDATRAWSPIHCSGWKLAWLGLFTTLIQSMGETAPWC